MIQSMKKRLKNQKGLTLIELLAVIVILGIIAAIAVPSINNVIENTRNKATVAEGIQIINAAKIYRAENPSDIEVTKTDLADFVENIKSTSTYEVNFDNTTKTYSIESHESVSLANTATGATNATEKQLIDYKPAD